MHRIISQNKVLLFIVGVCLIGFAIYGQALNGQFQFDDYPVIVHNPVIQTDNMVTLWHTVKHPTRFIAYCSFALNYHFHQLNPFGYHFVNLMIHLANTLLVFFFAQILFVTPQMLNHKLREYRFSIAVFAALLFLTHPLQTESVSYITQRFTSLAVFFYLMTLYLFVRARLLADETARSKYLLCGAFVCSILGMLTKQITMTLPVIIVLLEFMFFTRRSRKGIWILGASVLALLLLIPSMYHFSAGNIFSIAHESGSHQGDFINVQSYALTQPRVILTYLRLFFVPIGQNLLYDFPITQHLFEIKTLLAIISLGLLLSAGFYLFNRNRLASFCIFFFFVALSVESTIIPIRHVIFEHRTYLPSISVFICMSMAMHYFIQSLDRRMIVMILVIGLCCLATNKRNRVWISGVDMWKDVIAKSPEQARPYYNLGYEYLKKDQLPEASRNFSKALEIDPQYFDAYLNRSQIFFQAGDMDQSLEDINQAIRINSKRAEAFLNRGVIYRQMGQYQAALKEFSQAIELDSTQPIYYVDRGLTWGNLGEYKKGIDDLNKAIDLREGYGKAYNIRASLHLALKEKDKAMEDFYYAIKYDPQSIQAYQNRAKILQDDQQYDLALIDLNKVIELNPEDMDAYSRRAFVFAKMEQLEEALNDFTHISKKQPDLSIIYKEKGKIYFKRRQYQQAAYEFNTALDKAPNDASGYLLRGLCHYELKEYKQALSDMNKAKSLGYPVEEAYFDQIRKGLGDT